MQTLGHIPLVSKQSLAKPPLAPAMQRMPERDPPPQGQQTERRAAMWGHDSPVRFDMVQVTESKRPSSYEMITATINRLVEQ